MTRQKWTTETECNWLKKRIPAFQEAQQAHKTKDFYKEVFEDWRTDFQIPQPTADEIAAAGSAEAAARNKRKAIEKRIFQWFHNNTWPTTVSSKRGVIPVKKSVKIPPPWQAYLKLYYEAKLKPMIDEEYNTYLASVKEGEKAKTRIQMQTEITRRELENEAEEVKGKVDAHIKGLIDEAEANPSEDKLVQKYQQGVACVEKTLVMYLKTLEEATGWCFCVLGGGPNPQLGGKIKTVLYETIPEIDLGLTFEETLGSKEWNKVLGKWNEHMHEAFPENVRKQRSCSTSPTLAPDQEDRGDNEPESDHDDQEEDSHEMSDANKAKAQSVPSATQSHKSEYEIERERNIAKNKQIFDDLFGDKVRGNDGPGKGKGKKKNTRQKTTGNAPSKGQTPIDSSSPNLNTNATHGSSPVVNDDSPRDSNEGQRDEVASKDIEAVSAGASMDVDKPELPINTSPLINETGVSPTTLSSNGPGSGTNTNVLDVSPNTELTENSTSKSTLDADASARGFTLDVNMTATGGSVPSTGDSQSPLPASTLAVDPPANQDSQGMTPSVDPPSTEPPRVATPSVDPPTTSVSRGATPCVSTPAFKVAPSQASSVETTIPDFATFATTGYISDEKNFIKLLSWCNVKNWRCLVEGWAVFEQRYRNNRAIPTKSRPSQIAWWMKNNRKLNRFLKIVKPADFIISWRQWWMAMQPGWRTQDSAWPPSRDIPSGHHWSKIAHSGPNGIFLLILSLGWWGKLVATGSGSLVEFETAIDDVLWVLF